MAAGCIMPAKATAFFEPARSDMAQLSLSVQMIVSFVGKSGSLLTAAMHIL